MRHLSHLRYPLDVLFSVSSHLAILRALQRSREGMSGRAIAREAGMNHQACALALRKLEAIGVVKRQGTGRTQLVRLNFDNYLIKELVLPLLRKENELLGVMREDIVSYFKHDAVAISLFGSVARGADLPGSDVDVLFAVKRIGKDKLLQKANAYSTAFTQKYGVRLSPLVLTLAETRRKVKQSDTLLKHILADGIDLLPTKLQEVIR